MKVCEHCGIEICTKDGVNSCEECDIIGSHAAVMRKPAKARAKIDRAARKDAMESIGLVRVRGAMGGVYWE